jgi:hypothetical protein
VRKQVYLGRPRPSEQQQQPQQILFLVPQGDRLPNRPNLVYPTPIPKTLYIMYHGPNWQSNGRMVLTTGRLYNTKAWPPLSPVKVQPSLPGQYTAQQTGLYNSGATVVTPPATKDAQA